MSGKWSFHTDTPEALWAVDEDGGEGIIDYALSRGMDEAVDLFRDWLKARCLERQRERETAWRRQKFRVVAGGRPQTGHD
ncbi:hypothetical protein [Methylococcus sp. EFPC2]|uniref:hypothetical protein n=1 Tax=Methylococcus sp. EFPC2 TaxID=2812648 RepID=UPI001967D4DC|nr:hypothetical protein [Methylococcus sp. EFPC2]QSA98620.1 hypothetical protein JWZ97_07455 [Methylococcus sp. EFPC2]